MDASVEANLLSKHTPTVHQLVNNHPLKQKLTVTTATRALQLIQSRVETNQNPIPLSIQRDRPPIISMPFGARA